tara:strand:- start:9 stop:287 length:279 start_codon:yes stop_codon:yes gene_type:complete
VLWVVEKLYLSLFFFGVVMDEYYDWIVIFSGDGEVYRCVVNALSEIEAKDKVKDYCRVNGISYKWTIKIEKCLHEDYHLWCNGLIRRKRCVL